jgi:hypothetical protein
MSQFTIDVDAEAVFLDGSWYTREDLSRRIKAMLDSGDFAVAAPSAALQELTQTLMGVRTMAFRCTPELADALSQLATRMGQSVSYLVREAVTTYITDANSGPQTQPQHQQPDGGQIEVLAQTPSSDDLPMVEDGTVRVQRPTMTNSTQDDLPKVIVADQHLPTPAPSAPQQVIAGPGALRAAGVMPDGPVELTNLKKHSAGVDDGVNREQGWFKQ